MPEMLLPMFLLEPLDPTQIVFRFSMRLETNGFTPQIGRTPVFETSQADSPILHGG